MEGKLHTRFSRLSRERDSYMEMMDFSKVPTPSYVVDERLLIKNLETLKSVMDRTGCKILLAQKAFSMYYFYPLIGKYLCGTTASGLNEAMLGAEEMGKEVHVFNPAYDAKEFEKQFPSMKNTRKP